MKFSFTTCVIVIFGLVFSVFVANISNLIAIEIEKSLGHEYNVKTEKQKYLENDTVFLAESENIQIADGFEHLMWFLQVSDIHVSIFHDPSRITEFQEFCERTVGVIQPFVVLATGDLTDAKTSDNIGSAQQLEEWQIYKNILFESQVINKTVWLDIRGNHDNFNIPTSDSRLNYYLKYTAQGSKHPHSYLEVLDINGDKYGFLGIDACLSPGPKRPFNFVGMLNKSENQHISFLIKKARENNVQYTVMFGHYPTSCIISEGRTPIRNIITEAPGCWVYLCGHFHMLGGLVPNMYTLQKTGYLELELGDWKDNRIYRLAAFDHGFFSFVDTYHGVWPVILILNPKHALYNVPYKEPQNVITRSTHVRVLIFSLSSISIVQVRVNEEEWVNASHVKGPLFVVKWDPKKYATGVHNINVRARDADGRVQGISQPFTLDGTRLNFKFWPRLALMSNISIMSFFGLALCFSIVPLCIFKVIHVLVKNNKLEKPNISNRFLLRWVRSFWILATVDKVFYPLVIYPLYLSVVLAAFYIVNIKVYCSSSHFPVLLGPWTVGEVIDGHIGAIFAWGLIVNNSYLPGSFTYAYGFLQICTFQFPLTLVLASTLDRRFQHLQSAETFSKLEVIVHHIPILAVISIQVVFAYFFWLAYGTLAFLIGPLRTWSVILAIVLWRISDTLPGSSLREANLIWMKKPSEEREINTEYNL